ncbi:hypothetical protein GCM10009743_67610 [Kribbella swartbergensis]
MPSTPAVLGRPDRLGSTLSAIRMVLIALAAIMAAFIRAAARTMGISMYSTLGRPPPQLKA